MEKTQNIGYIHLPYEKGSLKSRREGTLGQLVLRVHWVGLFALRLDLCHAAQSRYFSCVWQHHLALTRDWRRHEGKADAIELFVCVRTRAFIMYPTYGSSTDCAINTGGCAAYSDACGHCQSVLWRHRQTVQWRGNWSRASESFWCSWSRSYCTAVVCLESSRDYRSWDFQI